MAALATERNTKRREGKIYRYPVAASVKIYNGSLVVVDSSGYARPGRVNTTDKAAGRAAETIDNTSGAAGAQYVEVETGIFQFGNSTAGDLIALADRNADCFIVDDQTVAKTNGTSTRSVAGRIVDVDASGVWVEFR